MTQISFAFTHYDLKDQRAGSVVEVTLNKVANVRLMTNGNFDLFKNARQHKFLGGVAKKSPIRLTVPESGHWHLIVDMEGHPGKADSSIKVTPPAKPQAVPRFNVAS